MNIYSPNWKYVKVGLYVLGFLLVVIPPIAILPWIGALRGYPRLGMFINYKEGILAFGKYIVESKNFIIPIPMVVVMIMALGGSFIITADRLYVMLQDWENHKHK